jgi:hypothetical protein
MNITPNNLALIIALSTLSGAALASIVSLINNYITKRSEERKHQRELIINAALENRRQQLEINKVAPPGFTYVRSLDDYIIHMVALSDLLLNKKLDRNTIAKQIDELEDFLAALDSARAKKWPEYRK